jgi:outer membrane biosynthesis protein TonB
MTYCVFFVFLLPFLLLFPFPSSSIARSAQLPQPPLDFASFLASLNTVASSFQQSAESFKQSAAKLSVLTTKSEVLAADREEEEEEEEKEDELKRSKKDKKEAKKNKPKEQQQQQQQQRKKKKKIAKKNKKDTRTKAEEDSELEDDEADDDDEDPTEQPLRKVDIERWAKSAPTINKKLKEILEKSISSLPADSYDDDTHLCRAALEKCADQPVVTDYYKSPTLNTVWFPCSLLLLFLVS